MTDAPVTYRHNGASVDDVRVHLHECDPQFVPPLSSRTDLDAYALKMVTHAERCEAWNADQLVGLVAFYHDAQSHRGYITNVSVSPSFSGRGIGRRLMEDCFAWCARQGCDHIDLEVSPDNAPALALYRRLGFVPLHHDKESLIVRYSLPAAS